VAPLTEDVNPDSKFDSKDKPVMASGKAVTQSISVQ
jgi:hypothetical protein